MAVAAATTAAAAVKSDKEWMLKKKKLRKKIKYKNRRLNIDLSRLPSLVFDVNSEYFAKWVRIHGEREKNRI